MGEVMNDERLERLEALNNKRFDQITTELSRLSSLCVQSITKNDVTFSSIEKVTSSLAHDVWGNGSPGLKLDVDRLKRSEATQRWYMRALAGGFITVVVDRFLHVFSKT